MVACAVVDGRTGRARLTVRCRSAACAFAAAKKVLDKNECAAGFCRRRLRALKSRSLS
jgi:hypothetical protein